MFRVMAVAVAVLGVSVATAQGQITVDVGNTSVVQVQFKDDAFYQFNVSYDGTATGIDLLRMIEDAEIGFDATIQDHGFGEYVDGLSYDGHSNAGYGGGEDWWHYWTRDSEADDWSQPQEYGASGRTAADGTWDGWVYGSDTPPGTSQAGTSLPEPATFAIVGLGSVVLLQRRRR
jgi:hypothetical protein